MNNIIKFIHDHWMIISYILLAIGSNLPKWDAVKASPLQAVYQWFYDVVMALVNRHSPPQSSSILSKEPSHEV